MSAEALQQKLNEGLEVVKAVYRCVPLLGSPPTACAR